MYKVPEKVIVSVSPKGVKVIGNRRGLLGLAEVCVQLANLPETREESEKVGNHYHYAEYMNNMESGSVPMELLYDPEL